MNNTLPLWEIQEIKDEAIQNNIPIWALIIGALAAFIGLLILPNNLFVGTLVIITSFIPTVIGVNRFLEIRISRKILEHIGVDEGHPWHPADEGESTKTRVKDVLGRWVEIPLTASVTFDLNHVTNESSLIDEEDEKIMQLGTHLSEKEGKKMELFINQALILSRTQEFEHDPTLKDARLICPNSISTWPGLVSNHSRSSRLSASNSLSRASLSVGSCSNSCVLDKINA